LQRHRNASHGQDDGMWRAPSYAQDDWSDAAREAALAARRAKAEGSKESHAAAANAHETAHKEHQAESKSRGEWGKPSSHGSHGYSDSMHNSAALYHRKAAETHGTPDYADNAKLAHRNSSLANSSSEKIRKAGATYQATVPEVKQAEPMTAQQRSAKSILQHMKGTRLGSRPSNIRR
jgi:hypothetical protein